MTDRIAQLKKLLNAEPGDAFCRYGLAMEYARQGLHAEALRWFDQTLEVDPDYCYAYFHKAKCLEDAGSTDAARGVLQTGLARARAVGDGKAMSELASYLDELS
jgi:tetratricopeptide (TPR) repeat protein